MDDDINEPPGARLRAWRRSLGFTQAQMGAVLGVDGTTLRKYEQGVTLPSGSVLLQASNMGLDLNWLMSGASRGHADTAAAHCGYACLVVGCCIVCAVADRPR